MLTYNAHCNVRGCCSNEQPIGHSGGGVEVVVRKSRTKSTPTIFLIDSDKKILLRNTFYKIIINYESFIKWNIFQFLLYIFTLAKAML